MSRKPIIVCAANRYKDLDIILTGARHWDDIMRSQFDHIKSGAFIPVINHGDFEQGFIDQFGVFHNRVRALKIVKESGQPFDAERNVSEESLYSEGLY